MSIRDSDAAWLAGFLEGEGTFQITRYRQTRWMQYEAGLSATNTNRDALEKCQQIAGGTIYGPVGRGRDEWKKAYRWNLRGTRLAPVLEAMMPHLASKRTQAALLLLMRRETRVGAISGEFGRRAATNEQLARRETMKLAMHALNHRGGLPVPCEQEEALAHLRSELEAIAVAVA